MGLRYVVDTNIVSEIMRPQPHAQVQSQWQKHTPQIALASVTWHELLAGTHRLPLSTRRTAFEAFLLQLQQMVTILPYDQAAEEWHAYERVRLTQAGRTPAFADAQIAATAAAHNLILVTRNTADFADFAGLTIENWFES